MLVDRFSASASEIVTGALQNYGRAVVIGDTSTHGKGSVQTVLEMKNLVPQLARAPEKSGAAKFTVQKYYLPNGSSTQLKGVVPDIVLPSIDEYLPRIKAPKEDEDLEDALTTDEEDSYGKVDVHLRESLRVLNDAVALGENRQYWASNHPPLTAMVTPKG